MPGGPRTRAPRSAHGGATGSVRVLGNVPLRWMRRSDRESGHRAEARAREGPGREYVRGRLAVGARHHGDEVPPARGVLHHDRRSVLPRQPLVSPLAQQTDHSMQVAPPVRQPILVTGGTVLVDHAVEDAVTDERLQAHGEDVAGDTEPFVELLEPMYAEKRFVDYQQRPAIADQLERAGYRAVHRSDVSPPHGQTSIPHFHPRWETFFSRFRHV